MERYLIVGLGNPGEDYAATRHNAGFRTVDALADIMGAHYWKSECGAQTAKGEYHGNEIILAKPQSFMNVSGGPVKKLLDTYDIEPDHLIVIHDELDIPAGTVRVKFGGGHGGHNGLRSITDKLGTRDWYRVRDGIGRPPGRMDPADFVLSVPRGDAQEEFEEAVALGAQATLSLLDHGLERTQQEFHG